MAATLSPLDLVHDHLREPKRCRDGYMAFCPAHADGMGQGRRSLHVWPRDDRAVQLHCFAGCETADVLAGLGLTWSDLFPDDGRSQDRPPAPHSARQAPAPDPPRRPTPTGPRRPVKYYQYGPDIRRVRYEPKSFGWEHRDDNGTWLPGRGNRPLPLYGQDRLPDDRSVEVYVTEGEKDADTLAAHGLIAVSPGSTTDPWRPEWTDVLADRPIIILGDNDAPGRKRADEIARLLMEVM